MSSSELPNQTVLIFIDQQCPVQKLRYSIPIPFHLQVIQLKSPTVTVNSIQDTSALIKAEHFRDICNRS